MSNLSDKQVLELIEGVACAAGHGVIGNDPEKDKAIEIIYSYAHCQLAQYTDGCKNPHLDWVKEMEEDWGGSSNDR